MASLQVYQNQVVHKRLNSKFSSDLQNIVEQIKSGDMFRRKNSTKSSLDEIFRNILVEREFTFYAGYDFYMGTRLNILKDESPKKDAGGSVTTSKKVKNLFMLPGIPDPIPLTSAFMIDWGSNQASVKNEEIFETYGMRPSAHPGRASKETPSEKDENDRIVHLFERCQRFLALFDQIRFWDNREWKYFPTFFALAFLTLGKRDVKTLYAPFQAKSTRKYHEAIAEKNSELTEILAKITSLSNRWDVVKNSKTQTESPLKQENLMREYISMLAFLALIDVIDDDETIIENILLLDDISGMCTALWGTDIMKQILRRWEQLGKPTENPSLLRKITFKEALCEVCARSFSEKSSNGTFSNRLVQSFSYTDLPMLTQDNQVRGRTEPAKGKCYLDVIGTAREQYIALLHRDIETIDKLDQMTLFQLDYLNNFGGDFYPEILEYEKSLKFKKSQTDSKKQTLENYFIFRKAIEQGGALDYKNIIKTYTGILEGMQQEFFTTFSDGSFLDGSEKNLKAEPTRKNMSRIFSYRSLRWIWVRYFMIRRMQNKEIPVILYSFCDAVSCNQCKAECKIKNIKSADCLHKDSLEYRFIESIKVCYPVHLWPEPAYDKSNVKI